MENQPPAIGQTISAADFQKIQAPITSFGSYQLGVSPSIANPPSLLQKLQATGKSIAKPFVGAGVSAYNGAKGLEAGLSDYIGGESGQQASQDIQNQFASPRNIGGNIAQPVIPAAASDPNATAGQKFQAGTQIAGSGAEIGSTLVGGEDLANLGVDTVKGLVSKGATDVAENAAPQVAKTGAQRAVQIAKGANEAGTFAGVNNAGSAASDPNTYQNGALSATGKIVGAGAKGYAAGAATGLAFGVAGEGISQINKLNNAQKLASASAKDDVIRSDLTPDYHKSMIDEKVTTPDGKTNFRVNEAEGVSGKRTVNQSKYEAEAIPEVQKIENYPAKGTFLQKSQAVDSAISSKAEALKGTLKELDKTNPLNTDEAHQVIQKHVLDNLYGDAKDAILERGKRIEGGAERSSSVVGRYGQDVASELSKYDGTRAGILDLRKNLDAIYEDARGKNAFGSEHLNAIDDMHYKLRAALNKELDESSANAGVSQSLKEQSLLYRAKRVLSDKATSEAESNVGQYFQKHPFQKRIVTGLTRRAVYLPISTALGAAGITKLASSLRKK